MKMMLVIFVLGGMSYCLHGETVDGINFPDQFKLEDIKVVLNGVGTRKKLFVKIYHSGLYLIKKNNNGNDITNSDQSMSVRMHFVYKEVAKSKLVNVWNECFENVTNGKTKPIKKEIDQFCSFFAKEDVKKGDVFDLSYIPAKGLHVYKKNKLIGTVKGLQFKKALFSVWFGNNPIQHDLKQAMLGK